MSASGVTVVIPTAGRPAALLRTLDALARQTATGPFDVVVVSDGGAADTRAAVGSFAAPFPLTLIEQAAGGAAAARNRGAAEASGGLLLFLDDDVVPEPTLVAAHRAAHDPGERVVIGPYYPVHARETGLFRIMVRNWWEEQFARLSRPGHRFTYRDVLSGNLSLPESLFRRAGGFDARFPACGGEDWELGVRLLKLGAAFVFEPRAAAVHHERETMTLRRSLERARREGSATARLEALHPELRGADPGWPPVDAALRLAARRLPRLADAAVDLLCPALELLDALRLRGAWRAAYGAARHYWWWRGRLEPTPGAPADADSEPAVRWLEVDLAAGLSAAAADVDRARPHGVRISLDGRELGRMDPVPGAEPLRGVHLRERLVALAAGAEGAS